MRLTHPINAERTQKGVNKQPPTLATARIICPALETHFPATINIFLINALRLGFDNAHPFRLYERVNSWGNFQWLADELAWRQRNGERDVYLSDDTWSALQAQPATSKTAKVAPIKRPEPVARPAAYYEIHETATAAPRAPLPKPPNVVLPNGTKQERWNWLRETVLNCATCRAHVPQDRKIVFGVGNLDAEIFFCGEAPGADESIQGEPFVGRAGQLLTKIIQAMGLQREEVYIGNIMNWRPEMPTDVGNRPPTQEEMEFCLPYLKAQLAVVQPKVIVALGATAVSGLLGHDPKRRMGDVRGRWHSFEHVPLMITYHPSYILRSGTLQAKRQIWEDILQVMEKLHMKISPKQRAYFTQTT